MRAFVVAAVGAAILAGSVASAEADRRRGRDRGETTVIRRGAVAPTVNLGLLLALGAFSQQKQFREPQQEFYDEPKLRNPIPLK